MTVRLNVSFFDSGRCFELQERLQIRSSIEMLRIRLQKNKLPRRINESVSYRNFVGFLLSNQIDYLDQQI